MGLVDDLLWDNGINGWRLDSDAGKDRVFFKGMELDVQQRLCDRVFGKLGRPLTLKVIQQSFMHTT